jgi:hypothetical protein
VRFASIAAAALLATGCLWVLPIDHANGGSGAAGNAGSTGAGASGAGGTGNATGGAAGSGPDAGCTTNAECGSADIPAMCRASDHQCVRLITNECLVVYGNWRHPNAVYFGAFTHQPATDPKGSPTAMNYDLAVTEFNAAGGLLDSMGQKHPLVAVVCANDPPNAGPDPIGKGIDHLVDDLDVPVIVADLVPDLLKQAYAKTQAKGKDVFLLSPGPATKELIDVDKKGLIWHVGGIPVDLVPAYVSLVARVEQRVKSLGAATVKVAVVTTRDRNDPTSAPLGELYDGLRPLLQFNGQSIADNAAAGLFREFPVDAANPPAMAGKDLAAWGPQIVISMLGPQFTNPREDAPGVALTAEKFYFGPNQGRPYVVLNPINYGSIGAVQTIVKGIAMTDPATPQRYVGINVAGPEDRTLYNEYMTRLRLLYPQSIEETDNHYDSVYLLAYSMDLAGVEQHLTGPPIVAGILRLTGGPTFDVGPNPIPSILDVLRDRQHSIQLRGTTGLASFHSGVRDTTGSIYCFDSEYNYYADVETFDKATGKWIKKKSTCYDTL